jgi:hypothetical protein
MPSSALEEEVEDVPMCKYHHFVRISGFILQIESVALSRDIALMLTVVEYVDT